MATNISFTSKTLLPSSAPSILPRLGRSPSRWLRFNSLTRTSARSSSSSSSKLSVRAATDSDYSSRRSSSNEQRETIMLPGCDYNHWLIVMEFPKDPAPTREQMIETYLNTLATVLGRYSLSVSLCFKGKKYTWVSARFDETWSFVLKILFLVSQRKYGKHSQNLLWDLPLKFWCSILYVAVLVLVSCACLHS